MTLFNRSLTHKLAGLIAFAAVISTPLVVNAQDENAVETLQVKDSIYMLTGKGGNIGIFLGADGTFMIDDKFAPMSEGIMTAITAIGGDKPKYLVNTHFHGDHTGGNANFGTDGATIVSHHNVRKRLVEGSTVQAFDMVTPPGPKPALPVLTFGADMSIYMNEDHMQLTHVANAHTDGDAIVHFKQANVIHTGDLFFNGFYPFIDVGNGGSLTGMIDGVEQVIALSDANTKIIPGHGPLANIGDLSAYRDMLVTARSRLVELKTAGKSAEEIVAAAPLLDLEEQWGDGIFTGDKWISIVIDGL